MKKVIVLFFIVLSACIDVHHNSYELSSNVRSLSLNVFESLDSLEIKINDTKPVRNILLKKINGQYYTKKMIDTFDKGPSSDKDTSSNILFLSTRHDTSFVITYPASKYPSIPAESEDCSIMIKKFNNDVFYTKKTSLLNDQYFDLYFYNTNYRIIAVFYSRINEQYQFVDNKSEYLTDIMPYINKYKKSGTEL